MSQWLGSSGLDVLAFALLSGACAVVLFRALRRFAPDRGLRIGTLVVLALVTAVSAIGATSAGQRELERVS